ncbi:MAG: DUF3108 domain-containing protein [Bacteroidota bacterium]|nr:DUF3108 domain-containing protein [Bacteroidota bacterium]
MPQSSSPLQSRQNNNDTIIVHSFDTLRMISNNAFKSGEYLKFDVNYGFVTAGEAILKVTDTIYQNRKCFLVEFLLNSKPFFDVFYKVRDRYSTIIDAEGMFPWRFEQHIREGGYSRDFVAEFDQINNIAITSEGDYPIPPYVQDIMSAFYFVRTIDFSDFKPGQKIYLQNFYKDSTYELGVKFKGRQTVKVDAGKFNCIIVEPLAKEGGLFKSEGRIYVWLTDDEMKIPVMVTAKIIIGNVESELVTYQGVAGPIRAKILNK